MPAYEYRCNNCAREVTLHYKTYKDYDAATHRCPHCESTDLTRLIKKIAISSPSRDFTSMDPDDMLSSLESGDPREMGRMMQQLGSEMPDEVDGEFHEVTERLLKGEDPESIERDLGDDTAGGFDDDYD